MKRAKDESSVTVRPTYTMSDPVRLTIGREDVLQISCNVDVLGRDLLHDRERAIKETKERACRLIEAQLSLLTVRSK